MNVARVNAVADWIEDNPDYYNQEDFGSGFESERRLRG